MLQDYKGEAWELKLSNLNEEIDPEGSVMKLLSTKIIINLKKKEKKTWFQLLAKKQIKISYYCKNKGVKQGKQIVHFVRFCDINGKSFVVCSLN